MYSIWQRLHREESQRAEVVQGCITQERGYAHIVSQVRKRMYQRVQQGIIFHSFFKRSIKLIVTVSREIFLKVLVGANS